ncbi:lipid-binding SYLF domain-containing protein [Desulfobacterium sp. N47]|uniref:lipid-binding SYLF domain-containing protein n=1 Tax=Desulfobacterium sp. N47 TaxID=3115210 RepID=UPI003F4A6968
MGGNFGEGVVCARNARTGNWSPPAFFTVAGGSFGFQVGVESIDLVLLVMNKKGLDSILQSKVVLGGDISATAGPVGRTLEAGTDILLKSEIYSYSRTKGLFAGISLKGATIFANDDANRAFYGKELSARQITLEHDAKNIPQAAEKLVQILNHITKRDSK